MKRTLWNQEKMKKVEVGIFFGEIRGDNERTNNKNTHVYREESKRKLKTSMKDEKTLLIHIHEVYEYRKQKNVAIDTKTKNEVSNIIIPKLWILNKNPFYKWEHKNLFTLVLKLNLMKLLNLIFKCD